MINNIQNSITAILDYKKANPNGHVANVYIQQENKRTQLDVYVEDNNDVPYIFIDGLCEDNTNNCFSPNDYFFSLRKKTLEIKKESFKVLVTPLTR